MQYIFDLEVYPNLFLASFKCVETQEYTDFLLYDGLHDDMDELRAFVMDRGKGFIGFNLENYDNHIILAVLESKFITTEKLYKASQNIVNSDRSYKADVPYYYIDLYKVNNYDNNSKRTSLKWLEFSMRWKKMADLPYPFDKKITEKQIESVVKYCHNDIDVTEEFWRRNEKALNVRSELATENKDKRWFNMSEPIIGREIMLKEISAKKDVPIDTLVKMRTPRSVINVKEVISPKIKFRTDEFKGALEYFNGVVVKSTKGDMVLKGTCDYNLTFEGVELAYGVGGLHGSNAPGVYVSDEDSVILDVDFVSFYVFIGIIFSISPYHLGKEFCEVWQDIFNKRKEYTKSDIRNYIYKIVLNSVFGQMQSQYTPFYDPKAFLAITVNGQLIISMLTELISLYGVLIQVNTDGVTAKIRRDELDVLEGRLQKFSEYTGFKLEVQHYEKMVMRDVNNYIALTGDGKVKRKGMFEVYEDYVSGGAYHKNPSALIIPKALQAYFLENIPIEKTIKEEKNIHEFLYGIKKQRNFTHYLWKHLGEKGLKPDRFDERALRYYASTTGGTLYKHFNDFRLTSVPNAKKINMCLNIRNSDADRYVDLDRQHYIDEANKWKKIVNKIY